MSKRIILSISLILSLSLLAYNGYQLVSEQKEPDKSSSDKKKRSDLFALQELVAVLKPLKDAKSIDAEFRTVLIGSEASSIQEMGSFDGVYKRDSMHMYLKSIESENLLNKDYFVAIDHSEKMMFVERPELNTKGLQSFFSFGFLSDIDSLVNLPDSVVFYSQINENTAKLTIEWESAQYYKTELIYDLKTKSLQEIHLYPYQDIFMQQEEGEISDQVFGEATSDAGELPLYVAIIYKGLKLNIPIDVKWFDASRYFKVENRQFVPSKSYKDYEIDFE